MKLYKTNSTINVIDDLSILMSFYVRLDDVRFIVPWKRMAFKETSSNQNPIKLKDDDKTITSYALLETKFLTTQISFIFSCGYSMA